MIINVTQEHIDRGRRADSLYCPIALAIEDKCPNEHIDVDGEDAEVGETIYMLPPEAIAFAEAFDNSNPVCPFSFDIIGLERAL